MAVPDATITQSISTPLENNLFDPFNYAYEMSNTFFATQGEVHDVYYNVTSPQYTATCLPNLCLDCAYELELSITDDCQNECWMAIRLPRQSTHSQFLEDMILQPRHNSQQLAQDRWLLYLFHFSPAPYSLP